MRRLALLLTTLALSVAFIFVPSDGNPKAFYPFSEIRVHADTYFYLLFEHLILVILALVIRDMEPKYRLAVTVFLLIQIIDTLDYLLFYGEKWGAHFPEWLTWNFLKVGIMALSISVDLKHNGKEIR